MKHSICAVCEKVLTDENVSNWKTVCVSCRKSRIQKDKLLSTEERKEQHRMLNELTEDVDIPDMEVVDTFNIEVTVKVNGVAVIDNTTSINHMMSIEVIENYLRGELHRLSNSNKLSTESLSHILYGVTKIIEGSM